MTSKVNEFLNALELMKTGKMDYDKVGELAVGEVLSLRCKTCNLELGGGFHYWSNRDANGGSRIECRGLGNDPGCYFEYEDFASIINDAIKMETEKPRSSK